MNIRDQQARCASLGFWPGPIDGVDGKRTKAAMKDALASQYARGLPFVHPTGVYRVHMHWTAGTYTPNAADRSHYHEIVTGDGELIKLFHVATHMSHTLNANTGAIGISMCCMAGAVERPFDAGSHRVTSLQLSAMSRRVAQLCQAYDIPVSPWSVLTHAEVQPTLGIKQRQKWDICWIPGMPQPGAPVEVGNRIRAMVARDLSTLEN